LIKLQFQDGRTVPIDLDDEQEAERWVKAFGDPAFQESIRGAVFHAKHSARGKRAGERVILPFGIQGSIPRPDSFSNVWYEVEIVEHKGRRVGERIVAFADDVRLTATSYHSQPAFRIELVKMGKRRIRT
jgi:hypothetical protein